MEEQKSNEGLKTTPKRRTVGTLILIVLLILIAVGGIGYSVYSWQQNKSLQATISSRDAQVRSLNSQISSLKKPTAVKTGDNIIPIRELGISITVPDSIKDLTYSYESFSGGFESVGISTQSLTDKYNSVHGCTSYDGGSNASGPALGYLERINGQYKDGGRFNAVLVKQFSSYYIDFAGPQSACVNNQGADVLTDLQILKNSLSTVREL